ncbi:hypothetical protein ACLOJK_010839 [Asimina triloba]
MLVAVALLVRRYYQKDFTPKSQLLKLVAFLAVIIGSSIGLSVFWVSGSTGWISYAITLSLWFLGTLGIAVFVPQQRAPKVWGVPLVPWLPSFSIATNLFLIGSLGSQAFIRFAICTAVMLLYYLFFAFQGAHRDVTPFFIFGSALPSSAYRSYLDCHKTPFKHFYCGPHSDVRLPFPSLFACYAAAGFYASLATGASTRLTIVSDLDHAIRVAHTISAPPRRRAPGGYRGHGSGVLLRKIR